MTRPTKNTQPAADAEWGDDEQDVLVQKPHSFDTIKEPPGATLSDSLASCLYISHSLSMWNSRLFEFGATLFLADIFPGTLVPMSIYAMVRCGAAVLFSPAVGAWIDRGNRLLVVRASIVGGRASVVVSCLLFWRLKMAALDGRGDSAANWVLFVVTALLSCVEKLCAIMNTMAVERDWVVVITEDNEPARRALNARMRRIDLLCKLLAPVAVSLAMVVSTLTAIWGLFVLNMASVGAEYLFIKRVYARAPALHCRPTRHTSDPQKAPREAMPLASALSFYFSHPAGLSSFSLALLSLSVLCFSGRFITYLVAIGYTSLQVGLARTVSSACEMSATWLAPRLISRVGVFRSGVVWFAWKMFCLGIGVNCFFGWDDHKLGVTGLAVAVALRGAGFWGYELSAQIIVQDEVEGSQRGAFSAIEAAFQNAFEMLSYGTTLVFFRPEQFKWPVIISTTSVYLAGMLFMGVAWSREARR